TAADDEGPVGVGERVQRQLGSAPARDEGRVEVAAGVRTAGDHRPELIGRLVPVTLTAREQLRNGLAGEATRDELPVVDLVWCVCGHGTPSSCGQRRVRKNSRMVSKPNSAWLSAPVESTRRAGAGPSASSLPSSMTSLSPASIRPPGLRKPCL